MKGIDFFKLCVMAMTLAACSNMRHGVGLRGIEVSDGRMTLDGDTFAVRCRIGDSLLVVSRETQNESEPDYLIKMERNGFYYVQTETDEIDEIDGTDDFVVFGNRDVYDIRKKETLFRTECDLDYGLSYLGRYESRSS